MPTLSLPGLARAALLLCVLAPPSLGQGGDPRRGAKLFEERSYPAARTEFAAVLARDARDASALFYMGRIALAEGRSGEAVDWLEKAVKANGKSSEYHLWLANALGEEAQRANKLRQPFLARRVKSEFDRAVQLDPRSVAARRGLMDFYMIAPGVMGGSKEKAREQAAEIAKISPLQGRFAAASIAQREKNGAAAEREYVAAVTENPDSAIAHLTLSVFYQNAQRWDDAFGVLDRLLAAKPPEDALATTRSGAHYRLGMVYEKQGKRDLARTSYEEAIRINSRNDDARKALETLKMGPG